LSHVRVTPSSTSRVHAFFVYCAGAPRDLHSFPTRRSSDLQAGNQALQLAGRDALLKLRESFQLQFGNRLRKLIGKSLEDPQLLRSEEHTSELQSRENLVCRLLLEKKKQ